MMYLSEKYREFYEVITSVLPKKRVFTDALHTLTYGSDASFYRMIPKIIIFVKKSNEVQEILKISNMLNIPIVFRAAGTSLSG